MRNSEKQNRNGEPKGSEKKVELEADVDDLFRLPLAEFTGARNTLATRLKKNGRGDDAVLVKALVKPSSMGREPALLEHSEAFDRLIASGERFHKAQTSRLAGKLADMRGALDLRDRLEHSHSSLRNGPSIQAFTMPGRQSATSRRHLH